MTTVATQPIDNWSSTNKHVVQRLLEWRPLDGPVSTFRANDRTKEKWMPPQGRTAVYTLYSAEGEIIYVGISNSPHARWKAHADTKDWWSTVATREIEWFPSRLEAEARERLLISECRPMWNLDPGMPENRVPTHRHDRIRAGWTPDQTLLDLVARYESEQATAGATRDELESEIVAVMMKGVSASRMAKFLPWGVPTIQAIGKKGGVPLLRRPTVRSIREDSSDPTKS
ncbi:GIY-YIG nuclease family protein [Streptantibioticus silvisoli]|uniref:GIY-YIG nuclease family protein n=1 Tax=Streptantibioticus silvisoli TaxID=2705255 RepID=A0ABT6W4U0_9ACTN|nr:GIY-YIG nuclease family protein [Streptantibioticus silvisoli]MDI5965768.1 GIY-YIG nuclease family protein [Streptantibioticus silvisoli]